ncbi:flotillin, partial [Lecanoromycetidae sp. Uapishka_2]
MWKVAEPNQILVITGVGIPDIKTAKKSWIWPGQKCRSESISPFDFEITLQAMTIEKLQFTLPAVFTIGPEHDENDPSDTKLKKYFKLLTGPSSEADSRRRMATGRSHVQDIVKGIIEGETRVIISSMTMEEIFKERQVFKDKVVLHVQSELNQFGLKIYNANVKELQDAPGSEYFKFLSRKAHEGASNQAKVDVANACMMGEIGEAEKRGKTRQEISKIDAATAVLETQRKSEKATADAELATTQTRLNMGIDLAKITATRQAESKDAELQRDVELKRAEMELERMRATDLVQATIKKESAQQAAEAKLFAETKNADGLRYKQKQDAEGRLYSETKNAEGALIKEQQDAEARYYRVAKEAEAALYAEKKAAEAMTAKAEATYFAKKKDAEALTEMAKAYGHMSDVMGGPQGLLQYLMLQDGTYEKLAKANAQAIKGLEPKITVWNTGEGSSGSNDGTGAIRNIMQALPPLFSTINDQTGISPPAWLAQMGQGQGQGQVQALSKGKQVNGVNGGNGSH